MDCRWTLMMPHLTSLSVTVGDPGFIQCVTLPALWTWHGAQVDTSHFSTLHMQAQVLVTQVLPSMYHYCVYTACLPAAHAMQAQVPASSVVEQEAAAVQQAPPESCHPC
jgi:hypothetical protein